MSIGAEQREAQHSTFYEATHVGLRVIQPHNLQPELAAKET